MSQSPTTVAVIGLDGADFSTVQPLIEDGRMPNLKAAMERGVWASMHSTDPPQSSAAWTSMCTGVNPGRHGIVGFKTSVGGTYETRIIRTSEVQVPHIWDVMRRFDGKSIVSNIPSHYPPVDVNGVMITGLLTPDAASRWAHPPEIVDELEAEGLGFRPPLSVRKLRAAGHDDAIQLLNDRARIQLDTLKYLLDKQAPDLLFCVFHTADLVQHAFMGPAWHEAGGKDAGSRQQALQTPPGRVIARHYAELDRIVGQLFDALPEDAAVMIVSDHGFGPKSKLFYTERWLQDNGYLRRTNLPTLTNDPKNWRKRTTGDLLKRLGLGFVTSLLSEQTLQRQLRVPRIGRIIRGGTIWRETKAFCAPGTCGLGIRINVKEREPMGIVSPGGEYENVREELIAELSDIRDPDTGETLCERVWKTEEVNPGDAYAHGPDVLMRMRDEFVTSPGNSGEFLVDAPPPRMGAHHRDGIFAAAGKNITSAGEIRPISLLDIAPTVLALQGIRPPEHIEGEVIEGVECGGLESATPRGDDRDTPADTGLTEDEQQVVTDRLRDLGYL